MNIYLFTRSVKTRLSFLLMAIIVLTSCGTAATTVKPAAESPKSSMVDTSSKTKDSVKMQAKPDTGHKGAQAPPTIKSKN